MKNIYTIIPDNIYTLVYSYTLQPLREIEEWCGNFALLASLDMKLSNGVNILQSSFLNVYNTVSVAKE